MLSSKSRVDRSGQKLTEISLGTLESNEKVTELILSNNLLRDAPDELPTVFPNLQVLRLDKNLLRSVPAFVAEWSRLTKLDLAHNGLEVLPPSLGELSNLRKLDLRRNCLSALPDTFSQLTALHALNLSENRFAVVPPCLAPLRATLDRLELASNPLIAPPLYLLKKSVGYDLYPHIAQLRGDALPYAPLHTRRIEQFDVFLARVPHKESLELYHERLVPQALTLSLAYTLYQDQHVPPYMEDRVTVLPFVNTRLVLDASERFPEILPALWADPEAMRELERQKRDKEVAMQRFEAEVRRRAALSEMAPIVVCVPSVSATAPHEPVLADKRGLPQSWWTSTFAHEYPLRLDSRSYPTPAVRASLSDDAAAPSRTSPLPVAVVSSSAVPELAEADDDVVLDSPRLLTAAPLSPTAHAELATSKYRRASGSHEKSREKTPESSRDTREKERDTGRERDKEKGGELQEEKDGSKERGAVQGKEKDKDGEKDKGKDEGKDKGKEASSSAAATPTTTKNTNDKDAKKSRSRERRKRDKEGSDHMGTSNAAPEGSVEKGKKSDKSAGSKTPSLASLPALPTLAATTQSDDAFALFCVFDGHGGGQCSDYLEENFHCTLFNQKEELQRRDYAGALSAAVAEADRRFLDHARLRKFAAGSTLCAALLANNVLTVANVGDSRAVLCRGGYAVALTADHTPERSDEVERIEKAGGYIEVVNEQPRVMGRINMTRSVGDLRLKEPIAAVISQPDITSVALGPDDLFILLGSDGLFDVYTNEEAVDYILTCPNRWTAAEELLREASKASVDNLTCLIVWLNWGYDHAQAMPLLRPTVSEGNKILKERVATLQPTKSSRNLDKKDDPKRDSTKKDKREDPVKKDKK